MPKEHLLGENGGNGGLSGEGESSFEFEASHEPLLVLTALRRENFKMEPLEEGSLPSGRTA